MSHINYCHCGVGIFINRNLRRCLAVSQLRIMNKVFSCADDCSIGIYDQDTDDIHLNYDDVAKVVKTYTQ